MKVAAPWRSPGIGLCVLLLLLAILAALQFRWTGELSRVEHERLARGLQATARRMAQEVDREASLAFLALRPPMTRDRAEIEAQLTEALADWRSSARYPELVHSLWLLERSAGVLQARVLERQGTAFRVASPEEEREVAEALQRQLARSRERRLAQVDAELPGLILPLIALPEPDAPRRRERRAAFGYEVVLFDREVLARRILPELAADFFPAGGHGEAGAAPAVFLLTGKPGAALPLTPEAGRVAKPSSPDASAVPILQLLPREELHQLRGSRSRPRRGPPLFPSFFARRPGPAERSGWWLVVRDPGGVDSAVSRARQRNLTLGLAVLALLGLSAVALYLLTRRTQGLARRQLEFTAGISHELRTPLAAIRSLGQNLGDGIVKEPEQVRRYGRQILQESIRLADLVERTLELGGVLSGRSRGRLQAVSLAAVARGAIADCAALFASRAVPLEADLPAEGAVDVLVRGDPEALQRAVANLLTNAVKFGATRVAVQLREGSGETVLEVADRGPGIPHRELPHLFEPFFRGQQAIEQQIAGSGLGLSLVRHAVEASGGTVQVSSREDEGTTFTLRWRRDGTADPHPVD